MPDTRRNPPPNQKALVKFLVVKARDVSKMNSDHFRSQVEIARIRNELNRFEQNTYHAEVIKGQPTSISDTLPVQQLLADVGQYLTG